MNRKFFLIIIMAVLLATVMVFTLGCDKDVPSDGGNDQSDTDNVTLDSEITESPVTDAPATDAPVTDAPVTDAPITDAPVTDAPVTDAPVTDAPTTEAPATDAPTTEAPAIDAPTTEAPVTDAPVTEAPDTEAPESVVVPVPSNPNKKLTYEEYNALSAEEQLAYFQSFPSMEAFFEWYNKAKQEYEDAQNRTEIGDGGIIDWGDIFGH